MFVYFILIFFFLSNFYIYYISFKEASDNIHYPAVICKSFLSFTCSEENQFEAYFASGSDGMFTVLPSSGTLLPVHSDGTLITVLYKPTYYGKTHRAKLLIQVII